MQGWPKLQLRVQRVDSNGKIDTIAYGVDSLPTSAGSYQLKATTWRPMSGWIDESHNFFLQNPPKLASNQALAQNTDQRPHLTTVGSGFVHIQCDVLI